MRRRQFMAGAASAAATVTFIRPSLVRGSQANSKVEVGCIGLGMRGNLIARKIVEHGGYRITAVADYFPQVADEAGQSYGVPRERRFSGLLGYRRLVDSKVDAVFLETPPYCFPEHVTAAVNAGCHVYMAKPVAVDVPGSLTVLEMGRKAARKDLVFLVDFQTRTHPYFIEAIRRVRAGALRKIGFVSSVYTDDGFRDPPKTKTAESRLRHLIWVNDVELGGGMLVNAGIHAVDVALWVADQLPLSAMGRSSVAKPDPHGDTQDVYSVTYRFRDGTIWNHRGEHFANAHGFVCRCKAFGQGAHMEGNYEGYTGLRGGKLAYAGGEVKNLYVGGIEANLKTFHRSILEGDSSNPTLEPSVNSTVATILGRDACSLQGTLTWDEMMKAGKTIEADLTGMKE